MVQGRDRVPAIRCYRSRARLITADENTPLGSGTSFAARGDARPPRTASAAADWRCFQGARLSAVSPGL